MSQYGDCQGKHRSCAPPITPSTLFRNKKWQLISSFRPICILYGRARAIKKGYTQFLLPWCLTKGCASDNLSLERDTADLIQSIAPETEALKLIYKGGRGRTKRRSPKERRRGLRDWQTIPLPVNRSNGVRNSKGREYYYGAGQFGRIFLKGGSFLWGAFLNCITVICTVKMCGGIHRLRFNRRKVCLTLYLFI